VDTIVHRYEPFTVDTPDGIGLVPHCVCGWTGERELVEVGGYEEAIDQFEAHVLEAHGVGRPARMI
jgi:hypothetical protein